MVVSFTCRCVRSAGFNETAPERIASGPAEDVVGEATLPGEAPLLADDFVRTG